MREAYFAADMFIQALKKAGKTITPEAHAEGFGTTRPGRSPGFVGPTESPASTGVVPSPDLLRPGPGR